MKLCKDDLLVNIFKSMQGIFDICSQSKNMADFLNSQGKLETLTLNTVSKRSIINLILGNCEETEDKPLLASLNLYRTQFSVKNVHSGHVSVKKMMEC